MATKKINLSYDLNLLFSFFGLTDTNILRLINKRIKKKRQKEKSRDF